MGDGSDPWVLAQADLDRAVGLVAGTDNDTTNLSLVAAARRSNPPLFLAARQNRPASAPLFAAMEVDALLVPTEVVAHEVYAQLSTPLLWRFLREMPAMGDEWAAGIVDRLTGAVRHAPADAVEGAAHAAGGAGARVLAGVGGGAPRAAAAQSGGPGRTAARDRRCWSCAGGEAILAPDDDFVLQPGDELLLAGWAAARRALDTILLVDGVLEYVVTGRRVPSSWIWRRLSRRRGAADRVRADARSAGRA